MRVMLARFVAAASVVAFAATADAIQQGNPMPVSQPFEWLALVGVFSGTLYRARLWFDEKGFKSHVFKDDALAIVALCVISLGVCEWMDIHNFSAALLGAAAALVGLEFLTILGRKAAEKYLNIKSSQGGNDGGAS